MKREDIRRILGVAELLGFTASRTSKGHWKFERAGVPAVFFSGTPGDVRAVKNGIAKLRRAAQGV